MLKPRPIKAIDLDIARCNHQIALIGNKNDEASTTIKKGFEQQLHNLAAERDTALKSIPVISPEVVVGDESSFLGI